MYEIEELKYDFVIKNSGSFCQACLSSDRSLSSIGEYVNVFRNISNNILPQPLFLCWECMAMLKKIKLFKEKLEEAQQILTYHYLNKQKLLLQTLSKLTKTYTDHTIFITHNDEEDNKEKVIIKQENEHSNDSFHNYDENNAFSLQEIKKENDTEPKVTKKEKSLHYRIVYEKNAKKVLRKKFAIQPENSQIWLDRERNCDFYKEFKYKCKLCVDGFNSKEKLKRHILKYHDESAGPYICPTCNIRFISEPSLSAHIDAHEFAWECARCGFQCYSVRRLNAHINTHSAVQCVYCEAKFHDLATFYTHYKSLHAIFLCDHCGKRCKTKHMLEKHMSRHLDTHTCSICSRHYKSRAALRKHFSLKHSSCVAEQAYCVLCDKQYESEHVYRRHVHTSAAHRRERESQVKKKFPCPECSNTYSRRAYMMNHYRHVHMNQSKHYCSECDRHFLNRTRYVDHMRFNHEGVKKEKNKLCNICGRGFAANRTLLNHMRTHSGERPYECEYCSAKFTQRTSMLSHVKYIHMKSKRRAQWQQEMGEQLKDLSPSEQDRFIGEVVYPFLGKAMTFYKKCNRNKKRFRDKHTVFLNKLFIDDIPVEFKRVAADLETSSEICCTLQPLERIAADFETSSEICCTSQPLERIAADFETSSEVCSNAHTQESTILDVTQSTATLLDSTATSSLLRSSTPTNDPSTSYKQDLKVRKRIMDEQGQPQAKIIKSFASTITSKDGSKITPKASKDLEEVIKHCLTSPKEPSVVLKKVSTVTKPYTPEEALGLIVDRKLSVQSYKDLRQDLISRGYPAFPPYREVLNARKACYAAEEIGVSKIEASVSLPGLPTQEEDLSLDDDEDPFNVHDYTLILENENDLYESECELVP